MSIFFNYNNPSCLLGQSSCPFSIDPSVSSLKELLIYELKQISYYIIKLSELSIDTKESQDKIIYTISIIGSNLDLKRDELNEMVINAKQEKEQLEKAYLDECHRQNLNAQPLKPYYSLKSDSTILSDSIHEGERQGQLRHKILSEQKRYLYEIIINLIENCALYLTELDNYETDATENKLALVQLLNITNFPSMTDEKWLSKITEFARVNCSTMKKLSDLLIKTFGPMNIKEVDTSIIKGPAILVSGHFFKDLIAILESSKDQGVNIYTHNGMILAHSSESINKYSHLVGHYQRSSSDAVVDIESFPGPVLMTKNAQINRNIIRGRIFTTDEYPAIGMSKINNMDFSPLIDLAKESRGFEREIQGEKIKVGYNKEEIFEKLNEIINGVKTEKIKRIILVDILKQYPYKNEYLDRFFEIIPNDYFVISLSYPGQKENIWHMNSYFGHSVVCDIMQEFKENFDLSKIDFTVILTQCNIQTISYILNFKELGINDIHMGNCCPLTMSPALIAGLNQTFGVKYMTKDPEKDFEHILPKF